MDRDVPQRRDVEVAHVLLLALGRPAAIDVGQVVVGAARLALERARRPHARKRPAIELGRRRDDDRLAIRQRDDRLALQELLELLDLRLRPPRRAVPGCRMLLLGLRARPRSGSPPFSRPATLRNSSCTSCELAQRNRQQALGAAA